MQISNVYFLFFALFTTTFLFFCVEYTLIRSRKILLGLCTITIICCAGGLHSQIRGWDVVEKYCTLTTSFLFPLTLLAFLVSFCRFSSYLSQENSQLKMDKEWITGKFGELNRRLTEIEKRDSADWWKDPKN